MTRSVGVEGLDHNLFLRLSMDEMGRTPAYVPFARAVKVLYRYRVHLASPATPTAARQPAEIGPIVDDLC